jgi:hypothetical protein
MAPTIKMFSLIERDVLLISESIMKNGNNPSKLLGTHLDILASQGEPQVGPTRGIQKKALLS